MFKDLLVLKIKAVVFRTFYFVKIKYIVTL